MIIALLLTDSRNGWGGLGFAIPFVIGPINWTWFLPLFFISLLPLALAVLPGVDVGLQELAGQTTHLFYRTDEAKEGRNAFLEKRNPDFSGSDWLP